MNWNKISFRNGLALLIMLLCFGYFYYISSSRFPVTLLKDISDIKIAMITIVTGIIGYYYGSSKSKDSTDNLYIAHNKKTSKMITGHYVDLPSGALTIAVNGGEEVSIDTYTDGTVTPETETHYGLVEWGAEPEITEVLVNGESVTIQSLIGGQHPVSRPK